MASQIAAHVTLAYPSEVGELDEMTERVADVARRSEPFGLELGGVVVDGDADRGVFVDVRAVDGGWAHVRDAMAARDHRSPLSPHVTLVHPRTSGLGTLAWSELEGADLRASFVARSIAVTAFDGHRWITTSEHTLRFTRPSEARVSRASRCRRRRG